MDSFRAVHLRYSKEPWGSLSSSGFKISGEKENLIGPAWVTLGCYLKTSEMYPDVSREKWMAVNGPV